MKIFLLHIIFLLSLSNIKILSQVQDSTQWINFKDDSLEISFSYPAFFKLNPWNYNDRDSSVAFISCLRYEPYELKENYFVELENYSSLNIYISNSDFKKIAEENNFINENNKWYEKARYSLGPADSLYFENWKGIRAYSNTSIGIKDDGIFTRDADIEVFLITKEMGSKKYIVCYAKGFDFPNGENILEKICESIK